MKVGLHVFILDLVEGYSPSDGGTCGEEGPVNESEDREPRIRV